MFRGALFFRSNPEYHGNVYADFVECQFGHTTPSDDLIILVDTSASTMSSFSVRNTSIQGAMVKIAVFLTDSRAMG
jgi:hypothetical protein